jgi:3-oxoacyl-[acyl-carrier protein] reductase
MKLEGKVALVTGGGGGIGKAIAFRFAEEGAKVIVNDLRLATAESVTLKLRERHKEVLAWEADVAVAEQVESMFREISRQFSLLDILANCAGFREDASLLEMEEKVWERTLAVNLTGCFHCTRAAGRLMAASGYGKIINLAADLSSWNAPGRISYIAANYGVQVFTRAASQELAKYNVNINCIVPDFVMTDMTRQAAQAQGLFAEEFREMAKALIPLRRLGTPEEVANLAVFLASEESSFLTGQVIHLRGGP